MFFMPTTRMTILGNAETENDFGDPISDYQAVEEGVSTHIWEESSVQLESSDGRTVSTHLLKGLVKTATTLDTGYRLKDEETGTIYIITHVKEQHSALGLNIPVSVELERVS